MSEFLVTIPAGALEHPANNNALFDGLYDKIGPVATAFAVTMAMWPLLPRCREGSRAGLPTIIRFFTTPRGLAAEFIGYGTKPAAVNLN